MNEPSNSTKGHRLDQQAVLASDPALGLRDNDGLTVLHHAAAERNYETLARCIEAGAPLDMADDAGQTPLTTAVITGWLVGANRLITAGKAAEDKNPSASERPLKHRMDIHGGSLLHSAAISGSVEAVDWVRTRDSSFLDTFAYPDLHGCTPVRLAAESNKPDAAQVIGRLLHWASELDESGSVISATLERPDVIDGNTPMVAAAANGNADVCTVLASWGAQVNVTNHAGESALCVAVRSADEQTVQILLDNGARLHLPSTQIASSPLTVARLALKEAENQGDEAAAKSAEKIVSILRVALMKPDNAATPAPSADEAPGLA